jgi:hypothetical protein
MIKIREITPDGGESGLVMCLFTAKIAAMGGSCGKRRRLGQLTMANKCRN